MRLIDEIDWGALKHLSGPAHDIPVLLRALTSADAEARKAFSDLDPKVFHPDFPTTANAPVIRVVAMMLAEGTATPEIRQALVEFLGLMAVSTKSAEKYDYFDLLPSLGEAMQQSYPAVLKFLDEPDLSMRRTAVDAAIVHVGTRGLAHHRPALAARLMAWARARRDERIYWVRELDALSENTEEFLADEDVNVRVAAALSSAMADNAVATEIIVEALSHAAEHGVAKPDVYSLSCLVCAAIARIDDLQRIAVPAVTIARNGGWVGFDDKYGTWGPLMRVIFQPPYSEDAKLTPPQRDFLAALIENSQI